VLRSLPFVFDACVWADASGGGVDGGGWHGAGANDTATRWGRLLTCGRLVIGLPGFVPIYGTADKVSSTVPEPLLGSSEVFMTLCEPQAHGNRSEICPT
jgi:hypothetical protein